MQKKYGETHIEVDLLKNSEIFKFINQNDSDQMDHILAKTVSGLSDYISEMKPDFIVIHSDRVEALAGYESLQVSEFTVGEQMDNNFVYLKVPYQQKAKSINGQIATLLTKKRSAMQLKRGRTKRQFMQQAECVPTSDKVQYLKFALEVYELKRKNPKLVDWQLSQIVYDTYGTKFSKVHLTKEQQQSKYPNADIKNVMSSHASRLRDTAKKMLNSVAIGKF